jgi:transcription initiation factor TFIIIB Brf1 subunit/transcription initiation factor TFIIB
VRRKLSFRLDYGRKCSECNGSIYIDHKVGEAVCTSCGSVEDNMYLASPMDYESITEEEKSSYRDMFTVHEDEMKTVSEYFRQVSKTPEEYAKRVRRHLMAITYSTKDRQQMIFENVTLKHPSLIAIGGPKSLLYLEAARLLRKLIGKCSGRSRDYYVLACIYISSERLGRKIKKIKLLFNGKKFVRKTFNKNVEFVKETLQLEL